MPIGSSEKKPDVVMTPADQAKLEASEKGRRKEATVASPVGSQEGSFSRLYEADRRELRRKVALVAVVCVALALVTLCADGSNRAFNSPLEVLTCYGLWFQQFFAQMGGGQAFDPSGILNEHPAYYRITNQVGVVGITAVAGVLLALAGSLYQSVFRNPIASPTMLGVSSGINLAMVIMVLVFGAGAVSTQLIGTRYLMCYCAVVIMLLLLFGLTFLMTGKGRAINVVNLLLTGTILNSLVGVVVNYVTWYIFDDQMWEVYNGLSEVVTVDTGLVPYVSLAVACVVAIVPMWLVRFRLNLLSFPEEDIRMLGVDSTRLRIVALVCGTIMMLSAQIHTGTVAMVALVVPHISRFLFGADFRKQFFGNVLLGAALMLLCRCIICIIPFDFAGYLGIGTIVNFVVMPAFVWMIATQQRSWE